MADEEYYRAAILAELEAGKLHSVEVDGELICLVRLEDGVFAFTDNCTHISGPLNEGEFDGCVVTCPWHHAQFDVRTGAVKRGPARQNLYTYPVRIEDGIVYVGLPPA